MKYPFWGGDNAAPFLQSKIRIFKMKNQTIASDKAHVQKWSVISVIRMLSTVAGWCSAGMILTAVGITCQMIFVRSVLNQSTVWQTDMIIYLIVSATFIGLSFVQKERGHVSVDLIPLALPIMPRFALAIFTMAVSILIIAIMFWYGFEFWHIAYSRGWTSDTIWGARLWIPYASVPIGFGLLLLQFFSDFAALILKIETPFGLEVS